MEMMEHSLLFFLTLGVYHGINPGMGWLFSVSIAMQKESTQKIFTSQIPIALGHLASLIVPLSFIFALCTCAIDAAATGSLKFKIEE